MDYVKNRGDLEYYFNSMLTNNYRDIKTKRKYGFSQNAIKSYIVESHSSVTVKHVGDMIPFILERVREFDQSAKIRETQEESLLFLETSNSSFYIDLSEKRYLIFHSADPSKVSDPFVKKFYNAKGYDSLWLPVPLILRCKELGRFWGLGVSFEEAIKKTQPEDEWIPEEIQEHDVSLSINRQIASQFFDVLMQSPELNRMMGISRISVLRSGERREEDEDNSFIIDDIRFNGKLTAKGNSFSRHSRIVYELVKMYQEAIEKLESYGFTFEEGYLAGAPITITFSHEINPRRLIDLIFTAEDPFRLWGIEEETGDNQFRVYAVDLHHGNEGNKLTFEITSQYMRVILPKYACSNTLLRLLSNLNHYVDAMAKMEVGDYELKANLSRT